MSAVRGLIEKMKALRADVTSPHVFYEAHREPWLALARRTVREVLANLRPAETDAEAWARQIEFTAEAVAAHLLALEDAGVVITLSTVSLDAPDLAPRLGFSPEEVKRWVAEGRGENETGLGKRLDERDAGKSDLQIAWRILYALKLNKSGAEGLRAALNKFLGRETGADVGALYPEILRAWVEVFTVQAGEDWRKWVTGRVAKFEAGSNRFGV